MSGCPLLHLSFPKLLLIVDKGWFLSFGFETWLANYYNLNIAGCSKSSECNSGLTQVFNSYIILWIWTVLGMNLNRGYVLTGFVTYVAGSKSSRPDIQKPRQMENAVRDI